ncbi:protein C12orf4 homolog [Liolophura sinensis]|uniref:protein C12orf4 homolog n=1 Tax=Liolophura sinensis TaxID=3198878 RepID=UPI00315828BE
MPVSTEKDFVFKFSSKGLDSKLTIPVMIPLRQPVSDLVGRLIKAHNLPCYVEDELTQSLADFVSKETSRLHDKNAMDVINKVKTGEVNVDQLVEKWTKTFSEEVKDFAEPEEVTNEQVFSDVYHTLIHSPALETLLNLEHTYALSMEDLIEQRDKDLQHLEERQSVEMEEAVQSVGSTYTDDQINQLAQRHFDNTQLISSKWASELSNLQELQKREYREWVMKVHEDTQANTTAPGYVQRVRTLTNSMPEAEADERQGQTSYRLEESFTIHLGAQMKTTHNLRLLCMDVLDLCRHQAVTIGGVMVPQPQRLQTAMSLYSNSLCGLVLLVDNRLNTYTGLKRAFNRVCEQSSDFHFPDLEKQLQNVEQQVIRANDWRQQQRLSEEGDKISVQSSGSSSSDGQDKSSRLYTGDFYITRHSNLSEVSVIFHLVTDDSVRSSDISSRHPVILSLRNILKACFRYDIHTLTIPLLLTHEMSEEMTIPWCLKRAELVFKCMKGFMMEMATWGGQESRTIQFLVPQGLSEEMFGTISTMLPQIFRLSNPVVVKSS